MESHSCDRHGIRSTFGPRRPGLVVRRLAKFLFAAVLFIISFTVDFGTSPYAQVAPNPAWAGGIRPDGQSSLLVATRHSAAPHGLTGSTASPERASKATFFEAMASFPSALSRTGDKATPKRSS